MIEGLKPYQATKNSGVAWLGDVPAHWKIGRIKHIAEVNPARALAANTRLELATFLPMERVTADGRIDTHEQKPVSQLINGFTCFRRNDVIVAKITPCFENGKGACLDQMPTAVGFGSTEFVVLRAKSMALPQFLYRLTTEAEFRRLGADSMTGSAGQQRVPQSFMANFSIAVPPVEEQFTIVRFLDHADRLIRRYVTAKRKLIKLLEEQKQAIIHRAVTRGLNTNVRLKPSGVDWLGDVPEHWEVVRSRRLFSAGDQLAKPDDLQLSATQTYGVILQSEFEEKVGRRVVKISKHLDKRRHVEKGDFVISMRSFQGGLERAWAAGCIRSSYVVLRPSPNVDVGFFSYLFKSYGYIGALQATANFIRDGQDLNFSNFCLVDLPAMPLNEQEAIAKFLDRITSELKSAIEQAKRQIDKIVDYRTHLIANVVAGKLDVRAAAATLPDAADEPEEIDVSERAEDELDENSDEVEEEEAA